MRFDAKRAANERVGTRIGEKWLLDRLLGIGGCASVYAATHRNGAKAAVKILHAHAFEDETIRTRFIREGYVANKVGHPGVVSVLDDDTTPEGLPYLVMELLEGRSLDLHRKGEGLPIPSVLHIGDQVLEVLERAHAEGIVHRDLKPANLFVTTNGQVKVLDFGIARLIQTAATADGDPGGPSATQTGLVLGTAAFMPPEQARARWNEVDGRADLWAVGATMLALMLGKRPRIAATPSEDFLLAMTEPMPPARTIVPTLAPAVAAVIDKALAFKRDDRWADAATMREALQKAASLPDMGDREAVKATLVNGPAPKERRPFSGTHVMPSAPSKESARIESKSTLPITPNAMKAVADAVAATSAQVHQSLPPSPPTGPTSPTSQVVPRSSGSKRSVQPVKRDLGPLQIAVSVVLFIALALASFTLVRLARR